MKEIVVLSGKGGTGKTSVTASLAVLARNDALIVDCDVDAANMHLLMKPDFGYSEEFYSGYVALINSDSCTSCGVCESICRFNAISFSKEGYEVDQILCEGCGYCKTICPTKSISLMERKSGNVYVSKTKVGNLMVHARLDIGAENSGKLVARVKNIARDIARDQDINLIIIDGSPGTGCPVVSSLSGADYVLFVTEPTVSGIHDLKRIIELAEGFNLKAGCIINKFDINVEKSYEIIDLLELHNIEHIADIPFDVGFTEAMVQAKSIVEIDSASASILSEIWEKLKNKFK